MGFDIHWFDKACPGMNHSVSIKTEAGKPTARVRTGGRELATTVERLDSDLWKVRFLLPKDAKGELELELAAGPHRTTEKKTIG